MITQNIDGLHQAAGSKNVLELHGSVLRNYCEACGKFYDVHKIKESKQVPECVCGGRIKPDVVLYEEGLDQQILSAAVKFIREAEVLAGLIDYYRGSKLVLVNKTPTPRDGQADLIVPGSIGQIFSEL